MTDVVARPQSDNDQRTISAFYADWLKEQGWEVVKLRPYVSGLDYPEDAVMVEASL